MPPAASVPSMRPPPSANVYGPATPAPPPSPSTNVYGPATPAPPPPPPVTTPVPEPRRRPKKNGQGQRKRKARRLARLDAAERKPLRDSFHSTISVNKEKTATCLTFVPSYEGSDGTQNVDAATAAAAIPAAADTSPIHQQASVEGQLVALGFDSQQVSQALADTDVGGDPEKAVAFLLAQSEDGLAQASSSMAPSIQEHAELLQWRSGTRRFVAEVIDLETGVIETGAVVTAPPPPVSSKRPLDVAEAGTSSSLSQVVQVKREKVEMQTKLSEKEKECERLEDDFDILNDGVEPMTTTINALQTKIDALYCIAYATVSEEHCGSLHALSGLGIDVKKRDGAPQIIDYTCGLISGMSPTHVCKAASALGIQRTGELGHRKLLQKVQEALGGTGPRGTTDDP